MRAWGHGMTWWARTTQKSGSRLLLEAAVPVWLWSACKAQAMASDKFWRFGAPCGQGMPAGHRTTGRRLGTLSREMTGSLPFCIGYRLPAVALLQPRRRHAVVNDHPQL